jgi:hypothetical protein
MLAQLLLMVRQNTANRWIAKMLATLVRFAVWFAIPLAGVDKA